jgi:hypothetical protein
MCFLAILTGLRTFEQHVGAKTVLAGLRLHGNLRKGRNALDKELRHKQVFINL